MACSCWLIWSSQICCYHQKNDLEIFRFKSLNYLSVFLQGYNFSTFGPACMVILRLIHPGPQKKQPKYFSCCHWSCNVNTLLARNKISLLSADSLLYNPSKYVLCISETFLDSSVLLDDHNLSI